MKILTILGARPQFIKAAVLSRALQSYTKIQEIIIHTGQHYDAQMSDIFFDELLIPKPDFFLRINKASTHATMTAQIMEGIEKIILDTRPNALLVYGDTNSTLAGALTASKLHIPIIHIEAGLRSFNLSMPEEINRIITDRISSLLFCPTQNAVDNLVKEGFTHFPSKFFLSGDVMIDALSYYSKSMKKPNIAIQKQFVLATIHRAENTDNATKLIEIFRALQNIAQNIQVILPLHPRTSKMLSLYRIDPKNITLAPPLSYLEMIWLLKHSKAVLTDSGGLQKEAYYFDKPCITLREESEWSELITHKCNTLAGSKEEKIIYTFTHLSQLFSQNFPPNLYGKADASHIIAKTISNNL